MKTYAKIGSLGVWEMGGPEIITSIFFYPHPMTFFSLLYLGRGRERNINMKEKH